MGKPWHGLLLEMAENSRQLQGSQYLLPRHRLPAWEAITKDKVLLKALEKGVKAPLTSIPQPNNMTTRKTPIQAELTATIGEYLADGVITKLTEQQTQNTRYWIPIFGRQKKDSGKLRLITDMRDLNACHNIEHHRPQNWKQVVQLASEKKHQWGITLDLKGYFHHLAIHKATKRWMRFMYNNQGYQVEAMPFGWSLSPFWSNRLAKPIRALLNDWDIAHSWWVDDILILGSTKQEVEQKAAKLVQLLTTLGIKVNQEKSMTEAARSFMYLGHHWDLSKNYLNTPTAKNQGALQLTRHQLKSNRTTPKHLAALAGTLLDCVKSNSALTGLPQQLMHLAGRAAGMARKENPQLSIRQAWSKSITKAWLGVKGGTLGGTPPGQKAPEPKLQLVLKECLEALKNPTNRIFRGETKEK
jgi:hypothetical protein